MGAMKTMPDICAICTISYAVGVGCLCLGYLARRTRAISYVVNILGRYDDDDDDDADDDDDEDDADGCAPRLRAIRGHSSVM